MSFELRDSELMSMVDPLPLNQTTSPGIYLPEELVDTPAWLQHMLLHLQGYDYILHYCPSKEIALPDALSHFSPCHGPDIPLDIAIHHTCLSPDQKEAFLQAFMSDAEMCALADIIITSWQDDIKEVPHPLHLYWQHHETLTIEDGLSSMEKPLLFLLHKGREYYTNYTSSIKKSPNCSCLYMDISSGLV